MTTRVRLLQSRFFCSLSLDYSVHFCASNLISLLNCFDFLVFGLRRCAQSCSCSFRGAEKGEKEGKKDRKKRERKKGEKIDRKEMESVDNDSVYISIGRRIFFFFIWTMCQKLPMDTQHGQTVTVRHMRPDAVWAAIATACLRECVRPRATHRLLCCVSSLPLLQWVRALSGHAAGVSGQLQASSLQGPRGPVDYGNLVSA